MSFPELCAPRTSLGVLYSETEVASLRAWLASGATGPALATAAPGSGLTTLTRLLLREAHLESVWISCGVCRVRALLEQAGANPLSVTLRRKVVVVDEFDALASTDSTAYNDALAFARSRPPLPVLFLSHGSRSQKSQEFAKSWPRFAFGTPRTGAVLAALTAAAQQHGVDVDSDALAALARRVRGDVRAALMALELVRRDAATPVDVKDEAPDGLDLVESVLRGERGAEVRECLRMFSLEPAVLPMGLYENYLTSLGKDDLDAVSQAADGFADADRVDRYLYARQAWDAFDVYGVCAVAVPSMALHRKRRSKASTSLSVTKFGSLWSKMYNTCAKTKNIRGLATKYSEAGMQPLSACDLAYVRRALRSALEAGDDDALRRIAGPLTAADVLSLARLDAGPGGSTWYKQTVHSRVKRALLSSALLSR